MTQNCSQNDVKSFFFFVFSDLINTQPSSKWSSHHSIMHYKTLSNHCIEHSRAEGVIITMIPTRSYAFRRRIDLLSSSVMRRMRTKSKSKNQLHASDPEVQYVHLPCLDHQVNQHKENPPKGSTIAYTLDSFSDADSSNKSSLVLVAIHGTLGSHRDFRYLAGACSQIGGHTSQKQATSAVTDVNIVGDKVVSESNVTSSPFPVDFIRVDLPGYGASAVHEGTRREISTDTAHYARTLWQFLDVLYPPDPDPDPEESIADDTAEGPPGRGRGRGRRDTRFVLLGHSLAGHIVMEMAASRQDVVRGIAFIASIGLRPHRGVGGTMFFPLFRRLGQHIDHPYAGPLMRRALVSGYVHMGGFSKTSGASDVIHSHRRVAALDFPSFIESVVSLSSSSGDGDGADTISDAESTGSRVVVDMEEEKEGEEEEGEESDNKNTNRRSRNSTMHAFLTYAANDPHIEESVQQELSRSLPAGPRLRFSRGGHNIQKTKSVEIAAALKTWIENIIITDEEPRSDKVVVEEKDESHRVCNK